MFAKSTKLGEANKHPSLPLPLLFCIHRILPMSNCGSRKSEPCCIAGVFLRLTDVLCVRVQSLLRGRFLRNGRRVNEGTSSLAASELGLLRKRQTVSGLRYVALS